MKTKIIALLLLGAFAVDPFLGEDRSLWTCDALDCH
jgi:hypothetical protein